MTDKNKQIILLLSIGGFFILFILIYYYLMFLRSDIASFESQAAKARKQISERQKKIAEFEKLISEDEEKRKARVETVEEIAKRLPTALDEIEYLNLLRDAMAVTNVAQSRLAPGSQTPRGEYTEIQYEIVGRARYHDFGQFVNLIESHPEKFMRVNEFELTNDNQRPSIHPMNIEISTFTFQGQ